MNYLSASDNGPTVVCTKWEFEQESAVWKSLCESCYLSPSACLLSDEPQEHT